MLSLGWIIVVALIPASQRPYIGSTLSNSPWEMVFGYNGVDRFVSGAWPGAVSSSHPDGTHTAHAASFLTTGAGEVGHAAAAITSGGGSGSGFGGAAASSASARRCAFTSSRRTPADFQAHWLSPRSP